MEEFKIDPKGTRNALNEERNNSNKQGINFINDFDVGNFIKDLASLNTVPQEASSNTPRPRRVNTSAANVKFGKLTLHRGSNKDLADVRVPLATDNKRKISRNPSPNNIGVGSKSKISLFSRFNYLFQVNLTPVTSATHTHLYKKFMTPKIKNSSDIKKS